MKNYRILIIIFSLRQNEDESMVRSAKEALESAEKRARIASDILRAMANEPAGRRAQNQHHESAENRIIACRGKWNPKNPLDSIRIPFNSVRIPLDSKGF